MSTDPLIRECEDLAAELAPVLEETYGVQFPEPAFKETRSGYTGLGVSTQYTPPPDPEYRSTGNDAGAMKVRTDTRWRTPQLAGAAADALAYASLYTNPRYRELREGEAYDDAAMTAMTHGVVRHVRETALRHLFRSSLASGEGGGMGYGMARFRQAVVTPAWDRTGGRALDSPYREGRMFFRGREESAVAEAVQDPEAVYREIVEQRS